MLRLIAKDVIDLFQKISLFLLNFPFFPTTIGNLISSTYCIKNISYQVSISLVLDIQNLHRHTEKLFPYGVYLPSTENHVTEITR